jgi:hypothetical protein
MEREYPEKHTHPTYKMTNHQSFEKNGYLLVPGMIENPEMLFSPVPKERGQISYIKKDKFVHTPEEPQVKGSISRYNFPQYKELHYLVKKEIEQILDIDLHPTYYFDRFYFTGQQLKRHSDRPSCEVSVTLQISTNKKEPWPIWFERPDESETFVNMKNGDAVIYKGCEREHWREPLESKYNKVQRTFMKLVKKEDDTYHHQIFLHYVNASGPYLNHAFDRAN